MIILYMFKKFIFVILTIFLFIMSSCNGGDCDWKIDIQYVDTGCYFDIYSDGSISGCNPGGVEGYQVTMKDQVKYKGDDKKEIKTISYQEEEESNPFDVQWELLNADRETNDQGYRFDYWGAGKTGGIPSDFTAVIKQTISTECFKKTHYIHFNSSTAVSKDEP